jgi:epsin
MEMLDKRLNDKGKNWRHVFKSLTVLDYLLHAGSENVVIYFRDNVYVIKTLKEFQYVDEYGKDQGANVRQKAKDISNLLMDEARLRQERRSRANMRDRMVGSRGEGEDDMQDENATRRSRTPPRGGGRGRGGDDDELRRAIEESKRSLAEEQVCLLLYRLARILTVGNLIQARKGALTAEERDLQQAIQLSEAEERKRHEELAKANQNSLFDDQSNNLCVRTALSYLDGILTVHLGKC